MNKVQVLFFVTLLFAASLYAHNGCGTSSIIRNLREQRANQTTNQPLAYTSIFYCQAEDFYDSVYSKKTSHFQIFYTLDGPHKTTREFIDSLAKNIEYAWDFHINKTGMLPPQGTSESYHYQKSVESGLYPVEVLEISLLRNKFSLLQHDCDRGCYGITIPDNKQPSKSTLVIDNDFKFPAITNPQKDSVHFNEKSCTYNVSDQELHNTTYGYSFAKKWSQGIRITTAHELYHAIQFRYLDISANSFWFEASAAGVEEIVHPGIDDYITYLPNMASSVGISLPNLLEDYGASVLFLYLYNHVDKKMDKSIWESFSKENAKPFEYHFSQAAQKKGLSADSLFHDFAVRLSFAGNKTSLADTSFWINNDQNLWPEFKHSPTSSTYSPPQTPELAFNFYTNGKPDLSKFKGKASVAIIKKDSYKIRFLPTLNSVDSAFIDINNMSDIDSTVWILSHFKEENKIPYEVKDSTLRVFPVPWRHGNLCFSPLPINKDYIEIRNRRGNLVSTEKYDNNMLCLDEARVKKLMVPGVYRFRVGNKGKLKDFIIVY